MATRSRTEILVRGYELDSYGHVNHAVYLNYLEHARWEAMREAGITLETMRDWGAWAVVGGLEISYLRPCFLGDRLEVATEAVERTRTSFTVSQEIRRGTEPVIRARVRLVTVNAAGRPTELPEPLVQALGIAAE